MASSSSSLPKCEYDVFLSFRGEDTRYNFTDHLYAALDRKGIWTFRDEERLERGTIISTELLNAIEKSRFAIIVLSRNYASSSWCLDELVKIVECEEKTGLKVWPVFYGVDPSDVRKQTGSFAEAFAKHEELMKNEEKLQSWRAALTQVAGLSGWDTLNKKESTIIEEIARKLINDLPYSYSIDHEYLVGIQSRVKEMENLCSSMGLNDVHFIGIWGMGGIGKTTIAQVLYDRIRCHFAGSSFLANVREKSGNGGLVTLQKQLLSDVLFEKNIDIWDVRQGINLIRNRLCHKKVLVILDDVDQHEQIEALADKQGWFGHGSVIIIITRDKHLLIRHVAEEKIYEPKILDDAEALKLFSLNAFEQDNPLEGYKVLSKEFVYYTRGHPLALKVLGSSVFQRDPKAWESVLGRLRECPEREVLDVLQISFDGLEITEQKIFLDIACFFKGMTKHRVVNILQTHYKPYIDIDVLVEKSLITILDGEVLEMHDLLQELGMEIVRGESCEPGRRSRLWDKEDVLNVLKNNTGTEKVEGIFINTTSKEEDLNVEEKVEDLNAETFSKMRNLRLLKICNVSLPQGLISLSSDLRLMDWPEYPLKSMPKNFNPDKLVELIMPRSRIKQLWEGNWSLEWLRIIDLSDSRELIMTLDFSRVPNLEKLILKGCTKLSMIHASLGDLKHLILLDLNNCKCLKSLPDKISLESLEIFILSGCSKLKKFPEIVGNMSRLLELYLDETAIEDLPLSMEQLTGLIKLDLTNCKNLSSLLGATCSLTSLKTLTLSGCLKLDNLPMNLGNLEGIEELDVSGTAIIDLPLSMEQLTGLIELDLTNCKNPSSVLGAICSLTSLKTLTLSGIAERETNLISLVDKELLSDHGTEVMEKEGRMSLHKKKIETVLSQTKEGQMKSKLKKNVGDPIQPHTPVAVSTSGTSNVEPILLGSSEVAVLVEPVTVEPVTILRSRIDGSQPINEEEIEILRQTDGQRFLERTCPKKSIECTLTTILGYMSDVKVRRVGVYGSGGIGKTSVLKALINYPTTKDLFDVVIWVTVSRNWSTRKIQDKVLQQLSLSPGDFKTDFELAEELFQALRSQRFLLLLDDVWEWIDLNAIGIPDPTYENGCRMILATRSPDVCHIMVADRKVQMEGLLLEEAWELFREQVGEIIDSPNIFPYAQAIVKKCHGLPLLIIVTGRALAKENDALNWMRASRNFLWLGAHGTSGFEGLIQQLKFSYDRLESPELKSCFLYCVLFPEDCEVGIVKLVEYWIEEGLVAGKWTDSYKRGCDIVNILVEASLLQKSEGGLSIKMHDLIRDLALGILSLETEGCQFLLRSYSRMTQLSHMGNGSFFRPVANFKSNQPLILEDHQFLSRAGAGLTELPLKEKWEEAKMIFLMDNELSSLPDSPRCPKLLALFLQRNQKLRVIPTSFFDLMPSLTVLNLSKTRIKSLPKSLCKLMSLEVLILRDCERLVLLPSEVGSLRRLEVLDLQGTEINKLPNKISELSSLIYLKVSFYGSVNWSEYAKLPHELVSHGVIANLLELETLSIDVYPGDRRWNKNVKSVIDEVGKLTNLTTFCCYFPEVEFLELFLGTSLSWNIGGLTKFKFVVGHDVKRFVSKVSDNLAFDNVPWDQCLRFVNGEVIPDAAVEVLTRTTAFYLDHHINVCSLSEFGVSNLDGLRLCVVRECPKIETIIAIKELSEAVFPILEHLSINYLSNLSTILEGMIPPGSFAKLRILTVHTCPKLQFVFASSMLHFFSNLEELIVEDCPAITEIIYQDLVVDSGSGTLPSLKKLKLHYLPRLVNIMKGKWPPIENISFYDCPILKKLGIDFIASHTIKGIKAENDWWKELEWQDTSFHLRLQAHFTPICDDDL